MSVKDMILEASGRYGVDPALALSVAERESGFDQGARGRAGEIGIFQLMPGTAAELGVDPSDLAQNIDGGVRYLARQLAASGGDASGALWRYNAGPGNAAAGILPASTSEYISSVLSRLENWRDWVGGGSSSGTEYSGGGGLDPVKVALGVAAVAFAWWILSFTRRDA